MTNEEFKKCIIEFLKKTGMAPTTFGLKAKNDPNFVFRIMSGQECREKGRERVLNFINNYNAEEK